MQDKASKYKTENSNSTKLQIWLKKKNDKSAMCENTAYMYPKQNVDVVKHKEALQYVCSC